MHKLKKYTFRFLLFPALVSLVIFSGCLNYEQETDIRHDGSGTMKIHYFMTFLKADSTNNYGKTGIFDADSVRKIYASDRYEIENAETWFDPADSSLNGIIEIIFTKVTRLNNTKLFEGLEFTFKDGAEGHKIFNLFIPPLAPFLNTDLSDYKMKFIYGFPGEIIQHNAQREEQKKLIWEYSFKDIGKGKNLSVTFKPFKLAKTPYWIYYLAGFVLIVVIFFLFRKKRD